MSGTDRMRIQKQDINADSARRGAVGGFSWLLGLIILAGIAIVVLFFGTRTTTVPAVIPLSSTNPPPKAPAISAGAEAGSVPASLPNLSDLTNRVRGATGEVAQAIARLLDNSAPMLERRKMARFLALNGSEAAVAALKLALLGGASDLKATIGESLGECAHPEAFGLMLQLMRSDDLVAAQGAIRGVATRGGAEAAQVLGDFLFDSGRPEELRTEAAVGLGVVKDAAALELLIRAATSVEDPAIAESVLEGIGRRPIAETEEFYRTYLASTAYSTENKVAALENLGKAEGDPTGLLLELSTAAEPELRAAAAWALITAESDQSVAPQLSKWLGQESSPEVRRRLYQALAGHGESDPSAVLPLVQKETDPLAKVAGYNYVAGAARADATSDSAKFFQEQALPELRDLAVNGTDAVVQMDAVMALRRANTPEAQAALLQIAGQTRNRQVAEAARAGVK